MERHSFESQATWVQMSAGFVALGIVGTLRALISYFVKSSNNHPYFMAGLLQGLNEITYLSSGICEL